MTSVVVIGGGLLGLSTAHCLSKSGFSVSLVEANEDVGLGASFQNGVACRLMRTAPAKDS